MPKATPQTRFDYFSIIYKDIEHKHTIWVHVDNIGENQFREPAWVSGATSVFACLTNWWWTES